MSGVIHRAIALAMLAAASPASAGPRPDPGYAATLPASPVPAPPADGAIFNAAAGYAPLYAGHRAARVGDPVTILLTERTTAAKSAGAKTSKSGGFGVTAPIAGPLSFIAPGSLNASGDASFKGDGSAGQSHSLSGELTVTIAEVRANGTALVRGEKRLMLSQGQEWIQFSGIVRLADLDAASRIASSRVADARIGFAGNGAVSREGWLSRFFNAINPF